MKPAARAGCGVDSPIVDENLKGKTKVGAIGRRPKKKRNREDVKCKAALNGLKMFLEESRSHFVCIIIILLMFFCHFYDFF